MKFKWFKKVKKTDDKIICNSLRLQIIALEKAKRLNEITDEEYESILKCINHQLKEMELKYDLD